MSLQCLGTENASSQSPFEIKSHGGVIFQWWFIIKEGQIRCLIPKYPDICTKTLSNFLFQWICIDLHTHNHPRHHHFFLLRIWFHLEFDFKLHFSSCTILIIFHSIVISSWLFEPVRMHFQFGFLSQQTKKAFFLRKIL